MRDSKEERKQYWRDFLFFILDLLRGTFIAVVITIIAVIYFSIVPWWVTAIIVAVLFVAYLAHNDAVSKGATRLEIDERIEHCEITISDKEESIRRAYKFIAEADEDEDISFFVNEIEYNENKIEELKKRIEDLKIQRTLI